MDEIDDSGHTPPAADSNISPDFLIYIMISASEDFSMIYVVQPGDTLYSIAMYFGMTAGRLAYDNQIDLSLPLAVGQALYILPSDTEIENEREPFTTKRYLGYAYPFIEDNILRECLLYMQALYVFSFGFTEEGDLIAIDDARLIRTAQEYQVEPVLVLTPFSESGAFNNQLVNVLLQNDAIGQRLIQNLLQYMQQKGYAGIDVDFEYVLASDKEAYVAFVDRLTRQMNENGFYVTIALPPKTSDDQPGLLYEGVDYAGLGAAANQVLLMTYEWGYTYSTPQAVAPIPSVRRVLDYGVSRIPASKIYMGLPNYGYDWPLPHIQGVTRAVTIGNIHAVEIAAQNGAEILFDEIAKSPYFNYVLDGVAHEVWFEDVRSMLSRFRLIDEYDFVGGGYWNLMRPFRPNWLLQRYGV